MQAIDFIATNRRADLFQRDPSFAYRCDSLARTLGSQGWPTRTRHIKNLSVRNSGETVFFHRPKATPRLLWLSWRLRKRGIRLIADFDDLVFDPDYAQYSPAVLNGILPLHKVKRAFTSSRKALDLFDVITVSTQPLLEHVQRLVPGKQVFVLPNAVHHSWLDDALPPADNFDGKTITYFPGTRSHDRDFRMIAPVIERFLDQYPDTRLQITGHLNQAIQARQGQVTQTPRVPFADYINHLRTGWVNLAPLEVTPFNHCKSALKVLEAGYWGIPSISSPNPDFERFANAGAMLASTEEQWFDALVKLRDREFYKAHTAQLRERVLELADPGRRAKRFIKEALTDTSKQ